MKLTKSAKGESDSLWFCGCERIPTGTVGYEKFDYYNCYGCVGHSQHEIVFSRKKMHKKYICHKHKCYMVEPYAYKGEVK